MTALVFGPIALWILEAFMLYVSGRMSTKTVWRRPGRCLGRGDEGVGNGDDLVARPDARRHQSEAKSVSAEFTPRCTAVAKGCELSLEAGDLGAADEGRVFHGFFHHGRTSCSISRNCTFRSRKERSLLKTPFFDFKIKSARCEKLEHQEMKKYRSRLFFVHLTFRN